MLSVVGHVEDKEGRLSAEEVCIDEESSGEVSQCILTLTIYSGGAYKMGLIFIRMRAKDE